MKTTVVVRKTEAGAERVDFESALVQIAKDAIRKIMIISPYFTYKGISSILRKVPKEVGVDIVVSLNPQDQTYIDHKLLRSCRSQGCRIFGVRGLHAKIYMADEKSAIVGSANLTYPSVGYRWECGISVENQSYVRQVVHHVKLIMRQSKELTSGDIDELERIKKRYIQKAHDAMESRSNQAEKEWDRYASEKPPESALVLTIDGTQFDRISRQKRKKFAVVKKAFFPAQWQIEKFQIVNGRLSKSIPILFYVRKWTDENSEGGVLVAGGKIPPYGYHKGSLRSLRVYRTRHFGTIPMFAIEPGHEDLDTLPRKKRQERAILVVKDYQEFLTRINTTQIEKVLESLKDKYEWIGEGRVQGPAGRYIPVEAYQILAKKANMK
jgi:hypothetical protein